MDERCKKLIRICANTKSAFTRLERFVDNYAADPKSEQLEMILKLINENWEKYNNAQDEFTNFVGAEKELKKIILEKESTEHISNFATQQGINFHFIPPCSPHMGGIRGAGVKSMKFHLHQVAGNAELTFEEFCTLLCQAEAVLNSRHICPLSNNPDNQVLTPGHFLIGTSLLALPDQNLIDLPSNRLSRWSHVQQMVQRLWKLPVS